MLLRTLYRSSILFTLLLSYSSMANNCGLRSDFEESFSMKVRSHGELSIAAQSIDLDISSGDRTKVKIVLSGVGPKGHNFISTSKLQQDMKIRIQGPPSRLRHACYSNLRAKIIVPSNLAAISLSTTSGNQSVSLDFGERLISQTESGNVTLRSRANEVFIKTVSGDISLDQVSTNDLMIKTVSGSARGNVMPKKLIKLRFKSVSGSLRLDLPDDLSGKLNIAAKTVSGDYSIFKVSGSGKLKVSHDGPNNIHVDTVSGDADIR